MDAWRAAKAQAMARSSPPLSPQVSAEQLQPKSSADAALPPHEVHLRGEHMHHEPINRAAMATAADQLIVGIRSEASCQQTNS